MIWLVLPMFACTDNTVAADDELGDDEGQDAGEPGPAGPGCEGLHELGHVLGFPHEHERFGLEDPAECKPVVKDWRTLTPADPFSVMGYDFCPGIAPNVPRLSAYDRLGAFYQYNWTRRHALMMGGGSSVEDLAYAGSARAGIAWYRPLAHEIEDELVVFESDGSSARGSVNAPEFSIPLAGRYRGFEEGGNDILWYQPHTNRIETWQWDDLGTFGFVKTGPSNASDLGLAEQTEYVPILGDFNGDEMTDLFWYAPGPRTDWLWLAASLDIVAFERHAHQVVGEYRPFPGDFDGNGIHDILWYSVADELEGGVSVIWYFDEDGGHDVRTFTIHGDYSPIVADFDHDECSDILWYDPASADGSSPVWRCVPGQSDFACDPPMNHPEVGFPVGYGGGY